MKKILLTFLIAAVSVTTLQAKRTKIKIKEYTVAPGDTLFTIARKHHTTTEEVRKSNSLERDQLIRVGQLLRVPTNTYFPKSSKKSKSSKKQKIAKAKKTDRSKKGKVSYTIAKGDTLFIIARKHHTTTQEVRDANGMERNALIRVGQVITVPTNTYFPDKQAKTKKVAAKAPKKGKVSYTIAKGDTLFTIARKHHTTTKELREANGMKRNALIRVGQVLTVPTNTYFPDGIPKEKVAVAKKKQPKKDKGIYEVQSGDTLFSIAKKNRVTLKEIMVLNDIKAGSVIRVGQKLKVSKKSAFIAGKKPTIKRKQYKTKLGDTLYRIAKREGISIKKLRALNRRLKKVKNIHSKLKSNMLLAVGTIKPSAPKKPKTYRVKKGDTLWLIAKKHKTTVKKLRALNKISRRTKLYRGMLLTIDSKAKASSARKATQRIAKNKTTKTGKKRRIASKKSRRKSNNRRLTDAMALLNGKSGRRGGGGNSHIIRTAKRYLGTRYVWGAEGPNRFDCSGFTQYVIRKSKGVRLPRVSRKQAYYGKYVSRSNLRAGDLIFFDTSRRRRGYVNHVGIYIGGSKFIHASSAKHRVVISSLNRPFYNARFKWGRRVN